MLSFNIKRKMGLIKYINKLFNERVEKGYDTLYIMVDVHNTILKPSFEKEETFEYFPYAKETLQMLSNMGDIKLIMWTSCYEDKIQMYLEHFKENGIFFDYVNENPEYENLSFACFDTKFYYDIGIDDKFGFDANIDWEILYLSLKLIFK